MGESSDLQTPISGPDPPEGKGRARFYAMGGMYMIIISWPYDPGDTHAIPSTFFPCASLRSKPCHMGEFFYCCRWWSLSTGPTNYSHQMPLRLRTSLSTPEPILTDSFFRFGFDLTPSSHGRSCFQWTTAGRKRPSCRRGTTP